MVAVAEEAADFGDGAAGVLLQQVHGEVAGVGDVAAAAAAADVGGRDAGAAADGGDDGVGVRSGGRHRRLASAAAKGESAFSMASGVAWPPTSGT